MKILRSKISKVKFFSIIGLLIFSFFIAKIYYPETVSAMTSGELATQINYLKDQVVKLQAELLSGSSSSVYASSCSPVFTDNLKEGDRGLAVTSLQQLLNSSPDTSIALSGDGSKGKETGYFGALTRLAVIKFQKKYSAEILAPAGVTKATGFVGENTRIKLNKICTVALLTDVSLQTNPFFGWKRLSTNGGQSGGGGASSAPTAPTAPTPPPPPPAPPSSGGTGPVTPPPPPPSSSGLKWGAYVGDNLNALSELEALVHGTADVRAVFQGFSDSFPSNMKSVVGEQGKDLVVFWEPSFGYDEINSGSKDAYIRQFATDAKNYGYPVILAPFDEMNLNEEAWGYGQNGNTAEKFKTAWKRIHGIFAAQNATNVKFAIPFNNVSIPNVSGNRFVDYYPGDAYIDYVGLDGFNFGNPWYTFAQVFDAAVSEASAFNKPIYILSMASAPGPQKATWIRDGLGEHIHTYSNVAGWIWFNEDKETDWRVNSDNTSLEAFRAVLP